MKPVKLIPFPKLLDIQQQQDAYKDIEIQRIDRNEVRDPAFVSYHQPSIVKVNVHQQSLLRNPNENELPKEYANSYHFPKRNITNKLRNQQTIAQKRMFSVAEEMMNGVVFLP